MNKHVATTRIAPWGCKDCAYLHACGGLATQQAMFGCFGGCGPCGVREGKCDYTCPRKPSQFLRDWAEVGGLDPRQRRDLPSHSGALPLYVPMIRHGFRRKYPLALSTVSVNTFDVLDMKCAPKFASADEFRAKFRLAANAQVLLVSVKDDRFIEAFWKHRTKERLAALGALGPLSITVPNFSFFDDAPRTHTLRNLWRIVRSAEELADAGLNPIVHVNALVEEDWHTWTRVLRNAPSARYVCKEFHTGLQDPGRAAVAVESLASLRDATRHDLHVIAVAGRRVAPLLAKHFDAFTIVDSVPFIASMSRKRLVVGGASVREVDNPTPQGESLDDLLRDNIREYQALVKACAASGMGVIEERLESDEP